MLLKERLEGIFIFVLLCIILNDLRNLEQFQSEGKGYKPELETCDLQSLRHHCIKNFHLPLADITAWARD